MGLKARAGDKKAVQRGGLKSDQDGIESLKEVFEELQKRVLKSDQDGIERKPTLIKSFQKLRSWNQTKMGLKVSDLIAVARIKTFRALKSDQDGIESNQTAGWETAKENVEIRPRWDWKKLTWTHS